MSDKQMKMADVFDLPIEFEGIEFEDRAGRTVSTGSFDHDSYIRYAVNSHDRLTAENEALRESAGQWRANFLSAINRLSLSAKAGESYREERDSAFSEAVELREEVERLRKQVTGAAKLVAETQKERDQLMAQVNTLKAALVEPQDWNWIEGREDSEDAGLDRFEIDAMQALSEVASMTAEQCLAAHDAEVIERFARELGVFDPEYDDQEYIEVPRYAIKEYANQLRQQANDNNS